MDAERVKGLGDRAQHFTALKETRAWDELKAIYAERKKQTEQEWLRALRRGEQIEPSYQRGFLDGIEFLIHKVDAADEQFEKALKSLKG